MNPYNCNQPGVLFTGYEDARKRIVQKLAEGFSFALVGGRRCGKTSLLLELKLELEKNLVNQNGKPKLVPRLLDMQAWPHTPGDFFRAVYEAAVQGCGRPPKRPTNYQELPTNYQQFLEAMKKAKNRLAREHGTDWIIVLLIDEFEAAMNELPECLRNLRNLLEFEKRFRVVVTGLHSPAEMSGILEAQYLSVLSSDEADRLVCAGFPSGLPPELDTQLMELTGRHPFLLQGLLGYLHDSGEAREENLNAAARQFVKNHDGTFRNWIETFRAEGCALYQRLLDGSIGGEHANRELTILSYHGVIEEYGPRGPAISGSLFREWFRTNYKQEKTALPGELELKEVNSATKEKRVFVVHGRNMRLRDAVFSFLRALGLVPLDWTTLVEATKKPAPNINEILNEGFKMADCAVVLFTPDDEARVKDEFRREDDPEWELNLTGQPRPNVLFEAGMAMAKFPERTVLVQFGPVRPFSNISGIYTVKMDNSFERRLELVGRLNLAGCDVNSNQGIEWHKAGDFSLKKAAAQGA